MADDAGSLLEFLASDGWHFVDHAESVDYHLAFDALNGVDDQGNVPGIQSLKGLKLVFKYSSIIIDSDLWSFIYHYRFTEYEWYKN